MFNPIIRKITLTASWQRLGAEIFSGCRITTTGLTAAASVRSTDDDATAIGLLAGFGLDYRNVDLSRVWVKTDAAGVIAGDAVYLDGAVSNVGNINHVPDVRPSIAGQ